MTTELSSKGAPAPARIVRCPHCGGDSLFAPSNVFRPFCSARCKTGDLGAWSSEEFRVPTQEAEGTLNGLDGTLLS